MKHAKKISTLAVILSTFSLLSHADELSEATDTLCEKMKSCGLAQAKQQNLPPEMEQMMEGMFDGMCKSMVAPYVLSTKDAGLEDKALACLESFNEKSCDELMNNNGGDTEECKEFEKAANEAYPDGRYGQ
jgi:hypothetical protein